MLIPKKAKEFIKPTADELGVSEELVSDLASFFWSDARKAIVEMRGHQIYVANLGTFKIKPWKLDEVIDRCKAYIRIHDEKVANNENMSFNRFAILRQIQADLDKAEKAKVMIEADNIKKQGVKAKRYGKGNQGSI